MGKELSRGGVYLARLDPAKAAKAGKIRPVVILTSQVLLDVVPPILFVCPLSSQSQSAFSSLHVSSYALVEHCRAISMQRIIFPRLAQLTLAEISLILHRLQRLVGQLIQGKRKVLKFM